MALIEGLLNRYEAIGFKLENNADKSVSITPTLDLPQKDSLPQEGHEYLIKDELFLDCSLNIFVSGTTGGFAIDSSERGLIVRAPTAPLTNAGKMGGTTKFMRYKKWLIGIGYTLDKETTKQNEENGGKTFKTEKRRDTLHITRNIEHRMPDYALKYTICINPDSSLVIKELKRSIVNKVVGWLSHNKAEIAKAILRHI